MAFNLLNDLPHWIQHQPNFETAHRLNGGWERWASADMAITFILAGLADRSVLTEDNCYRPYTEVVNNKTEKRAPRCDIAIKQVTDGVKSWDIIELKCWRQVATSLRDFIGLIASDIAKIRANVLDDSDPFKPYKGSNRLWAVGLMRATDVNGGYTGQQASEYLAQHYPTVTVFLRRRSKTTLLLIGPRHRFRIDGVSQVAE
ncbi:hypothetical protein GQ44DRAFT_715760 [Phaeosphaeriaceae sp. PMI808]|nr:hypothetical protein GQ44DRAFT_715760 [Phaeosphaeriaceae sp. PMI808]